MRRSYGKDVAAKRRATSAAARTENELARGIYSRNWTQSIPQCTRNLLECVRMAFIEGFVLVGVRGQNTDHFIAVFHRSAQNATQRRVKEVRDVSEVQRRSRIY